MFDEIGALWHALGSRSFAAQLEVLAGDLSAAEAVVGEIYRLREEHGLEEPVWWAGSGNGQCPLRTRALPGSAATGRRHPHTDTSDGMLALAVNGKVLARLGKAAEGEAQTRQALAWAAHSDEIVARAQILMAHGEVLNLANRGKQAAAAFSEALDLCEQMECVAMAARTRQALATVRTQS